MYSAYEDWSWNEVVAHLEDCGTGDDEPCGVKLRAFNIVVGTGEWSEAQQDTVISP